MLRKLQIFGLKALFVSAFGFLALNSAFAQMDHSAHMAMMGMGKPPACEGSGLGCANAATPFLTSDGKLYLTWTAGGIVSVAQSEDLGKTFSAPVKIAEHGKSLDAGGDARPQVVANGNKVFLTYAFFKDTHWNAQVNAVHSDDGGKTFSAPASIVNDTSSQRFPIVALEPNGKLFVSWIDKRIVAASKGTDHEMLGGSIAYALSDNFGQSFQAEKIANKDSCECCRIGAAVDPKGGVAIAYRAIFPVGIRDHASQLISDSGKAGPVRRISDDNWKTDVCPHQGPSIAVSGAGTFHVAWFTQGKNRSGVFYANSHDEGKTYSLPVRVGREDTNVSRPYLLALDRSVWLVWKEFDGQNTLVFMKNSTDDGKTWSQVKLLAQTSEYSDHPLLISKANEVFLSWLTREHGYQLIKIGRVQ
jgi:BNR repeat-like domain